MTVAEAVTLIGAITAALVSIITAIAALRTGNRVQDVHALVNGQSVRMEALARATGVAEGRAPAEASVPAEVQRVAGDQQE